MTTVYYPKSFPKKCSCGEIYSEDDWRVLRLDGIQDGIDDKGRRFYFDLEMRRCETCASTMAVAIREI